MSYDMSDGRSVPILGFRARSEDGIVYDSRVTPFRDLPDGKIVSVMIFLDQWTDDGTIQYRHHYAGNSIKPVWFFFVPGSEYYGRSHAGVSAIRREHPGAIIKAGSVTPDDNARMAIHNAAMLDREF